MPRPALTATTVTGALDEARRRIRKERRSVSKDVGSLLEAIARGLDDSDFDARLVPLKDLGRFRLEVGLEANAYLDQRRLEIAHHLACRSEVPVAEIGEGLGFGNPEQFRKWFAARLGQAPDTLRRAARNGRPARAEPYRPPSGGEWTTQWHWERLVLGAVTPEEASRLLLLLLAKYPQLESELPREVVES